MGIFAFEREFKYESAVGSVKHPTKTASKKPLCFARMIMDFSCSLGGMGIQASPLVRALPALSRKGTRD